MPFEGNIPPRLSKNLARAGATTVAELFSDANLHCLLEIERAIDGLHNISQSARDLLHLGVHAILYNCTRMYRHRAKGGFYERDILHPAFVKVHQSMGVLLG